MNQKRQATDQANKKWVRVLTVIAYIIAISLIALVLGLYYRLFWHPTYANDDSIPHDNSDSHYIGHSLNQTVSIGQINIQGINELLKTVSIF